MTPQTAMAPCRRRTQRGVGMIEVLIALVVVSLGVLAISRMQTATVQANQGALLRTQASLLAYDMVDRLRADRVAALAGEYDHALGAAAPGDASLPASEVTDWLSDLQAYLPAADGAIVRRGDVIEVSVRWDDSRGEVAPQIFATATEL